VQQISQMMYVCFGLNSIFDIVWTSCQMSKPVCAQNHNRMGMHPKARGKGRNSERLVALGGVGGNT
jgi:hypothetical protein